MDVVSSCAQKIPVHTKNLEFIEIWSMKVNILFMLINGLVSLGSTTYVIKKHRHLTQWDILKSTFSYFSRVRQSSIMMSHSIKIGIITGETKVVTSLNEELQ